MQLPELAGSRPRGVVNGWRYCLVVLPALLGGCAAYAPCPADLAPGADPVPPRQCRVDGCSMAPDFDFGDCCDRHDARYWSGGSAQQREQADLEFRHCIEGKGHPLLAGLYYHCVRAGGAPYLPTPWRWGFGWEYLYGFE